MNVRSDDKIFLDHSSKEFEQLYIELRTREKRIYTDEEVAWLPEVDENHIHKKEWEIRKASAKKLIRYLQRRNLPLKILEAGCGNGWFSYQLSQIYCSSVTGIDINLSELQQAERVFAAIPNLKFIYGSLGLPEPELEKFDVIVFAASIQYFPSFSSVMKLAFDYLKEKGEIHIVDSHFYSEAEISEAEERSRKYFHNKGFDRIREFYFHHSLKELEGFNYTILYNPNSTLHKLFRTKMPFHWICIRK